MILSEHSKHYSMIVKKVQVKRRGQGRGLLALSLLAFASCAGGRGVVRIPFARDPAVAAAQATQAGKWADAAHYWQLVFTRSNCEDIDACLEGGKAMLKLGDFEGASNLFRLGLEQEPRNADLLAFKGDALTQLGFRRSAEACYERCLAEEPDRVPVLCALGHLRLSLDRETSAIVPLQRAIDLGCDQLSTREHLAKAYNDSGEPLRAWPLYASRMSLDPPASPEFVAEAAVLSLNPKLLAKHPDATAVALIWIECSLLINPDHIGAHFQHGVISEALGNDLRAIASYQSALEIEPAFLPALTNLALLFAELEHEGLCRDMVARAVALESDHDRRIALWGLLEKFE